MEGEITALTANTSITVSATNTGGSGTLAAWTFTAAGLVGATGAASTVAGPQGPIGLGFTGVTSTSSLAIVTGSRVFAVTSTGAFVVGQRVRIVNTGVAANFMEGEITVLTANTSITVTVTDTGGSGTYNAWTFTAAGLVGPAGPTGAASTVIGPQGPVGPIGLGFAGVISATNNTIGTGNRTFTVTSTGAFVIGQRVRVIHTGTPANFMEGEITALTANSSITVNVANFGGSGSSTAWTFTAAGLVGATGPTGAASTVIGPQGPIGPTGLGFNGVTSTSSQAIGFGSKQFSVASTGAFVLGQRVRVVSTGTPANFVEGSITVLVANSSITVTVTDTGGAGTYNAWTFTAAGLVGPAGQTGATGATGATGIQGVPGPFADVTLSATPPPTPDDKALWFDTSDSSLNVWYSYFSAWIGFEALSLPPTPPIFYLNASGDFYVNSAGEYYVNS